MANTREHRYSVSVTWNGNLGSGTSGYRDYSRNYEIGADGNRLRFGAVFPSAYRFGPAVSRGAAAHRRRYHAVDMF
jgi:hypothetical protein